jgi:hypothetical protein
MELLIFHSTNCGPCQTMVTQFSSWVPPKDISLRFINTDNNPIAAIDYQIKGVPYVLLKNEKRIWEQFGFITPGRLEKLIGEKLAKFN